MPLAVRSRCRHLVVVPGRLRMVEACSPEGTDTNITGKVDESATVTKHGFESRFAQLSVVQYELEGQERVHNQNRVPATRPATVQNDFLSTMSCRCSSRNAVAGT